MSINKKNLLSSAVIVLSVTVSILGYKSYKDGKKATEIQKSLQQESILTQSQLTEMLKKYDSVMVLYNGLENSVGEMVSINKMQTETENLDLINPTTIKLVGKQIQNIKDSIKSLNGKLSYLENIETSFNKSILGKKPISKTDIAVADFKTSYDLTNIQARGVKFLNENSNIKTDIKQIRVCFTIDKSLGLARGDKELFIQIVNPKNSIITSMGNTYLAENVNLQYTKKVDFYYNQQETDVCNYIDIPKNRIAKGRYLINIYNAGKKIGSTIFNY